MPGWWNGRHARLKILWLHGRVGSTPAPGTFWAVSLSVKRLLYTQNTVGSTPTPPIHVWPGRQVVRHESAKLLYMGSIPILA